MFANQEVTFASHPGMLLGRNPSSELVEGTCSSPHSKSVYGVKGAAVGDCVGSWEPESHRDSPGTAAVGRASFAHET